MPPAEKHFFYRRELDWLRFAAFMAVWVHHTLPRHESAWTAIGFAPHLARMAVSVVSAGGLGVDLFFVLSSYLITELLLREQSIHGRIDVLSFYIRRVLRIWPLYFGFLALLTLFPSMRLPTNYLLAFVAFAANWMIAFHGFPRSAASPLWSVSIEEQFYIAWPLMLRVFGVHRIVRICVALLLLTMVVRAWLVINGVADPGIWCNTLARLDPIALGAIAAVWLDHRVPSLSVRSRLSLLVAGIVTLVSITHFLSFDGPRSMLFYPLSATASVAIMFSCLGISSGEGVVSVGMAYLGRISYGLYVFHLFTLEVFGPLFIRHRFIACLIINVAIAALSYELWEKPFLRLKARFSMVGALRER